MTNKTILILILLFSLAASADEGLYLELGLGHAEHLTAGGNPTSVSRLRYELPSNPWWVPDVLELEHHSSVLDGRPFNNNREDPMDQASVIWRFKLK